MKENEHSVRIDRGKGFQGKIFVGHRFKKKEMDKPYWLYPVKPAESIFIFIEKGPADYVPVSLTMADDVDVIFFRTYIESDDFSGFGWQLTIRNEVDHTRRPKDVNVKVGDPV